MSNAQSGDCNEIIVPNTYEPALQTSNCSSSVTQPFIDLSHFIEYYKTSENEQTTTLDNVEYEEYFSWQPDFSRSSMCFQEQISESNFTPDDGRADCAGTTQNDEVSSYPPAESCPSANDGMQTVPLEQNYKTAINYLPDFSDFQDETYSFWSSGAEATNEEICTYSPYASESTNTLESLAVEKKYPEVNEVKLEVNEPHQGTEQQLPSFRTLRKRPYNYNNEFQQETSTFNVCNSSDWTYHTPMPYPSSLFDTPCSMVKDDETCWQPAETQTWDTGQMAPYETTHSLTFADQATIPIPPIIQENKENPTLSAENASLKWDDKSNLSSKLNAEASNSVEQPQYYLLTVGGEKYLIVANGEKSGYHIPSTKTTFVLPSADSSTPRCTTTLKNSFDAISNTEISAGSFNLPATPTTPGSFSESSSVAEREAKCRLELTSAPARSSLIFPKSSVFLPAKSSSAPHKRTNVGRTTVNCASRGVHRRRKTVRELLQEKKQKKAIQAIARQCLANKSLGTITCPVKSVRPILTDLTKRESGKPSILVLQPDVNQNKTLRRLCTTEDDDIRTRFEMPDASYPCASDADDPPVVRDKLPAILNPPPFKLGRVDAKEYRPMHYDLLRLDIGNFKIEEHKDVDGKLLSKFKVLFTKRQFIYEFSASAVPGSNFSNRIACIVVPFSTVRAISCEDDVVQLCVNCQPQAFLGTRQQRIGIVASINVFDTSKVIDVTQGEAARSRNHKLLLRRQQANKLKARICNFDPIFRVLTTVPIDEEGDSPGKFSCLPAFPKAKIAQKKLKKSPVTSVRKPPHQSPEMSLPGSQVCTCQVSCRSFRCSCVKAAQKCNLGRSVCVCSNCDNPLNIMESIGIDPNLAVQDSCLFHNVYQINNFRGYLNQELKMPCCNAVALLQECIPFRVLCPNTDCTEIIEYSWCKGVLCCAERNPRNHCTICGRCCFSLGKHCQKCNACYPTRPRSPNCPNCSAASSSDGAPQTREFRPIDIVAEKDAGFSSVSASNADLRDAWKTASLG